MSSIISSGVKHYFKQGAIRNAANKLMLVEEQTSHKPKESIDPGGSSSIIGDGRFVPSSDKMTARHDKRGQTTFADGHVETSDRDSPTLPNSAFRRSELFSGSEIRRLLVFRS